MGERRSGQDALFYAFGLEAHVPADHLLRMIDQLIDFSEVRSELAPYDSTAGRPSICPELMIRKLFDQVLRLCLSAGLVGGEAFAVDGSIIQADADRRKGPKGEDGLAADKTSRAIDKYLAVFDDAAFGAASEKTPKFLSETDPAARYTSAHNAPACYAYEFNYLIDTDHTVIVDVEATIAIRQAEVEAAKRMLDRTEGRHGLHPRCLAADTGYGSGPMLEWLVEGKASQKTTL